MRWRVPERGRSIGESASGPPSATSTVNRRYAKAVRDSSLARDNDIAPIPQASMNSTFHSTRVFHESDIVEDKAAHRTRFEIEYAPFGLVLKGGAVQVQMQQGFFGDGLNGVNTLRHQCDRRAGFHDDRVKFAKAVFGRGNSSSV